MAFCNLRKEAFFISKAMKLYSFATVKVLKTKIILWIGCIKSLKVSSLPYQGVKSSNSLFEWWKLCYFKVEVFFILNFRIAYYVRFNKSKNNLQPPQQSRKPEDLDVLAAELNKLASSPRHNRPPPQQSSSRNGQNGAGGKILMVKKLTT